MLLHSLRYRCTLSTRKLYLFEWVTSPGFLQNSEEITAFLLGGLLSIILFTLLSFAFLPAEGGFEVHDLAFVQNSLIAESIRYILPESHFIGFLPGVLWLILFLQLLRSHIGEKRPVGRIFELTNSAFCVQLRVTALFYSAVFSCCLRIFKRTKFFFQKRILVKKEVFQKRGTLQLFYASKYFCIKEVDRHAWDH